MIRNMLSNLLTRNRLHDFRRDIPQNIGIFDEIVGYDGIKRTFVRSLTSKQPGHILLVGQPGQAKTMFLKYILETFGERKAFFTVGGNASKSGLIDVLFDMQPYYLLIDEIEHLKPEYQTTLLSLMETGILSQPGHSDFKSRCTRKSDIYSLRHGYLLQVMVQRNFQNHCLADSELCI
jgi:Holliday junction resolvasome RuvABC ATP-dependent DNA helicase subunit